MKMLGAIAIVLLSAGRAAAQPEEPTPAPPPAPWAEGVPEERRERALHLFRVANETFVQSEYAEAVRLYREALDAWDHPAIRGNLAVSLINLDQPVEAYEHLEKALAHGSAPFDEQVYQQLLTNRKLLLGQLARVNVSCDVAEAQVTLNGQLLLAGRGSAVRVVKAGSHQVVARKPGHLTFTRQFTALPERPVEIRVVLVPLDRAGGYERRWATWKPWAVVGAGAAVALIGVGLQLSAQSNIDDYEQEIARSCPDGCRPDDLPKAVRDLETRGALENRLAIGAFVTGGLVVVTGAVMVMLNQPRRVRLEESGRRVGVVPILSPETTGVALSIPF